MTFNDVDTNGKYCPFNGFAPPCGLCMFAVESTRGFVACAIAVMALRIDGLNVKNSAPRIDDTQSRTCGSKVVE